MPETLSQTQLQVREKTASSIYGVWFLTTLASFYLTLCATRSYRVVVDLRIGTFVFSDHFPTLVGMVDFPLRDVRATLAFVVSVFAMCYWKSKTQLLAIVAFSLIFGMAIIS